MENLINKYYTGLGYEDNSEMAQEIQMEFAQVLESHGAQLIAIEPFEESGNTYTLNVDDEGEYYICTGCPEVVYGVFPILN